MIRAFTTYFLVLAFICGTALVLLALVVTYLDTTTSPCYADVAGLERCVFEFGEE